MSIDGSLKRFPTIRAMSGDWAYYMTTLPFHEVAWRIKPATEVVTPRNMNYWIQRSVIARRSRQIAEYLIEQEQHFFPGIVVGVYMGEPRWYEIEVSKNQVFGLPGLDPRFQSALGILELDGTEELYAIDGQHRVAGIAEALKVLQKRKRFAELERLKNEDLAIVFVEADVSQKGHLERVRRLFTTLNKQAKRVSDAELVALDEDDAAAITTRRLAIEYDGLNQEVSPSDDTLGLGLIQMGTRNEIPITNGHSITTIVTLLTMIRRVFQPELSELKQRLKGNRPSDADLDRLYNQAVVVWEHMRQRIPALGEVMGTDPLEERAREFRTSQGGHVLFRPVGQQAFAGALGVLRKRRVGIPDGVTRLAQVPLELNDVPWQRVLWDPNQGKMVNANRSLAEALFLYMIGQAPRTANYDVLSRYQELFSQEERGAPTIPVMT